MNKNNYKQFISILPKFPGILGRENYLNSVVLVPFIFIDNEYHILFEKRTENISHPGEISFPGGKFDALVDSDFEGTAIRETCEELGLTKDDIRIDGRFDTMINPMNTIIEVFIGEIKNSNFEAFNFNKSEVAKIFTVPLSFFKNNRPEEYEVELKAHPSYIDANGKEVVLFPAKELNAPAKYAIPWGFKRLKLYVYKFNNEIIWGITAGIINGILKFYKNKI